MCSGPPLAPGEPGLITTAVFLLCLPAVPKNNTTPSSGYVLEFIVFTFLSVKKQRLKKKLQLVQQVGNIEDNERAFVKLKNRE